MSKKISMHIFAAVAIVLWALGFVMTRVAVQHFTAEAISFLRYFVAAIFLLVFAAIKKLNLPKLKDIPLFFVGGAIGFAVYVYGINVGSKTLTAAAVSFLVSASPIVTALLAYGFLREKISIFGWLSVLCAFIGVGVITFFQGGITFTAGTAWICLSMLLISAYNIYQRKLLLRYSPLEITTYCVVAGAMLLSVFALHSFPQLSSAAPLGIAAIVILGIFSAGTGYLCWAYALSKADKTTQVTNYMFITPLLTTFLGFMLIAEAPPFTVYIGGALVLAGVFLMNRFGIKKI